MYLGNIISCNGDSIDTPPPGRGTCILAVGVVRWGVQILTKVAAAGSPETPQPVLVVPPSEEGAGGVTVDGFIRLMRLFIDKKQVC